MISFLDLLFPPRCVGCGRVGKYICPTCIKTLRLREQLCPQCDRRAIGGATHPICAKRNGLDGLITVFVNQEIIKRAIKQLKYRFVSDMAQSIVSSIPLEIFQELMLLDEDFVLYPLPLHKDRLRWRGFNQARLLGNFVAEKLEIPTIKKELLVRVKKTKPQADIKTRKERIENAKDLFQLKNPIIHNSKFNILLFDDVWTTGATMKEAAKILKKAGVEKVWAVTLAR